MKSAVWKQFALLLLLALAVRLAGVAVWESWSEGPFLFPDSESYWALGQAIAGGQPYEYGQDSTRVFRTPGYPLLLAPIFWIAGEPPAVWGRVQNALLGTASVALVWCLARQLFDERTAAIAGLMAAIYPGAIAVSILVLSEAPFCTLMLLQLILWTAGWNAESPGKRWLLALATGLVAGCATLVRPSWLLFVPFAVLVGFAIGRQRMRQLAFGSVMLAAMVVVMTPWWIRNAQVTGRFVPTTLQVGASLYDGLNPNATGASDMSFVAEFAGELRNSMDGQPEGEFEARLDRRLRRESLDWALAHPGRVARLAGIKVMRMWNIWPNEPSLSQWPIRLGVLLTYVPIAILGIAGAVRTFCRGFPYILCWLPAVYFTLLHAVFIGSIRYRQPAMLGLIVLAAGGIGHWWLRTGNATPPTQSGGVDPHETQTT